MLFGENLPQLFYSYTPSRVSKTLILGCHTVLAICKKITCPVPGIPKTQNSFCTMKITTPSNPKRFPAKSKNKQPAILLKFFQPGLTETKRWLVSRKTNDQNELVGSKLHIVSWRADNKFRGIYPRIYPLIDDRQSTLMGVRTSTCYVERVY